LEFVRAMGSKWRVHAGTDAARAPFDTDGTGRILAEQRVRSLIAHLWLIGFTLFLRNETAQAIR
jgi:hypothetical protein